MHPARELSARSGGRTWAPALHAGVDSAESMCECASCGAVSLRDGMLEYLPDCEARP